MATTPPSFKIDENLPVELAELLTAAGHDASTVHSEGLVGAVDPDLARVCVAEQRVLVTLDLDFADIQTFPPERYPGFMVLRLVRQDKPHVIEVFRRAMTLLSREEIQGRLWIIEEHRVRIRGADRE